MTRSRFKGKVAIVTGGSMGIGRSTVLQLVEEGAHVVTCARRKPKLDELEEASKNLSGSFTGHELDVGDTEAFARLINETAQQYGRLDVLVNNASTNIGGRLETLTDEQAMERVMGKTLASMRCCRAALPHLRASGRGRVIIIGGASTRNVGVDALPSGLGNASSANFSKQFSYEVAADGVTVNIVHPSFTKSDRYPERRAARAKQRGITIEEAEASFAAQFPIGRIVEPDDIAPMVLFLASTHASAITGQAIAVDGGSTPYVAY